MKSIKLTAAVLAAVISASFLPVMSAQAASISVYKESLTEKYKCSFEDGIPEGIDHAGDVTAGEITDASNGVSAVLGTGTGNWLGKSLTSDVNRTEFDIYLDELAYDSFEVKARITGSNQPQLMYLDTSSENNYGKLRIKDANGALAGMIWIDDVDTWQHVVIDTDVTKHIMTVYVYRESGMLRGMVTTTLNADVGAGTNIRVYTTVNTQDSIGIDNYSLSELDKKELMSGESINVSELGDDKLYAFVTQEALYDNGMLLAELSGADMYENGNLVESDMDIIDITDLAYGRHNLTSGSAGFELEIFCQKDARVSGSDFNGCAAPPNGFSRTVNDGYVKFATIDEAHGTSVLFGSESEINDSALFNLNAIGASKCSVSFDMYINSAAQTYIKLRESGSVQPNILRLDANGEEGRLRVISGNDEKNGLKGFFGLSTKTWYNITLDLDMEEKVFSVSVVDADGKAKNYAGGASNTLSGSLIDGLSENSSVRFVGPKIPGEIAIDNLYVNRSVILPHISMVGNDGIIPADGTFDIHMSDAIDADTVTVDGISINTGSEAVSASDVLVSDDGMTITVTPSAPLTAGANYAVVLSSGIALLSGGITDRPITAMVQTEGSKAVTVSLGGITDDSGNPVIDYNAGDIVNTWVTVDNKTENDVTLCIIGAVYNNSKLMEDVTISKITVEAGNCEDAAARLSIPEHFGEIKTFVWESMENIRPMILQ